MRWIIHYLPFIACMASACVTVSGTAADYSDLVGKRILARDVGAKFLKDGNEVLAEVGKLYFVDRVEENKVWVRGQEGWLDGASALVARESVAFFTSQLYENPTAEKYLSRGQAWAVRRNFDRALTDFDSALRLNPDFPVAHTGRGNCLLQQKKYKDAIAAYTRAIEIEPTAAAAYNNRGNAWRAMGKFKEALPNYVAAMKLRPGQAGLMFSSGVCYSALQRYDAAIEMYNAVLDANPQHAGALNERGLAWQRKSDFLKAIASFTAAAEADPSHYEAMNNLAWLLANCKQKELRSSARAVETATRACKVTGFQNWYCLGTLAASYARDGKFKQAIATQKKALQFMPSGVSSVDRADYQKRLKIYQAGYRARI